MGKCLKIRSGRDQKQIEKIDGKYNIYGSGGVIGKTNDYLYNKPSVCIGRKGTIDRPYYFDQPFWTVDTLFYSEIFTGYNPKYLYYLFQTIPWKLYNTSTGVPSLTSSSIEGIEKAFPQENEQKKIAEFLSLIDERIQTQNKIIEDYLLLKDSIIHQVFSTNNPKVKLLNLITEVNIKNKDKQINTVLSVSNKLGFIKQSEQFEDREVASDDTSNYKVVEKGLYAYNPARINVGSIARLINYDTGIISPMYSCFKIDQEQITFTYFDMFLNSSSFKRQLNKKLEGSVRQCLTFDGMLSMDIELPSLDIQKSISNKIDMLNNKIEIEVNYREALIKQKQYLLNNLFI